MTSQTNSGDTKEDSLEKLFREIQWDREQDMRIRIQNEREDRERTWSSVYVTSDPRIRKTENGAFERQDFLVVSSLPTSLEPMSSFVHKRGVAAQNNTEDVHFKFATENFLRMIKGEKFDE